jgi:translocator protein
MSQKPMRFANFPWLTGLAVAVLTAGAAAFGGAVTTPNLEAWYTGLSKSRLNPPGIVFAIVWPVLFTLMATGALMVLRKAGSFRAASGPLGVYFTMLGANMAWSFVFFELKAAALALAVIVALWLLIWAMQVEFARFSRPAAWLQVPYMIWVSFAGYLNAVIWLQNPAA